MPSWQVGWVILHVVFKLDICVLAIYEWFCTNFIPPPRPECQYRLLEREEKMLVCLGAVGHVAEGIFLYIFLFTAQNMLSF